MDRRKFLSGLPASVAAVYAGKFLTGCGGAATPQPRVPTGLAPPRRFVNELNYVAAYGQSLSVGTRGTPAISTSQRFDSVMFAGGLLAQSYNPDLAFDYGSLAPLVEDDSMTNFDRTVQQAGIHGETTMSGTLEAIKELIASQDKLTTEDINFRLLGSCPGEGNTSISELAPGTVPYERLLYEVAQGLALAQAGSLTFGVPCITWIQGENDINTPPQDYLAALQNLFTSFNTDIQGITSQTKDVQFIMYQTAAAGCFGIAAAQYQLTQMMTNVHIGTPCYPFQTDGAPWNDLVHLTNVSYKTMGGYFGSAFKRLVVNEENWLPLSPATITASGNVITLVLNVYGGAQVVADTVHTTTTCPVKPSLGFTLLDASGNSLDIDGQVAVTGENQITITSPVPVASGFALEYGNLINGFGGGNIRDNYGDQYVFNGGGLNVPMHNWLTVFYYQFP